MMDDTNENVDTKNINVDHLRATLHVPLSVYYTQLKLPTNIKGEIYGWSV